MSGFRLFILSITSLLALSRSVTAVEITVGPFPDFKGIGAVPGPVVIPTSFIVPVPIPGDGIVPIRIRDRITINLVATPIPFIALTYATFSVTGGALGPFVGVTDIWALDQNPGGSAFDATGFDPSNPQLAPTSNEEFIGISGTSYPATSSATTTISDLPALLPGFDLSAFSGNPGSIVYIYQGNVPVADAVAPEPATVITLSSGIALILLSSRRRRLI